MKGGGENAMQQTRAEKQRYTEVRERRWRRGKRKVGRGEVRLSLSTVFYQTELSKQTIFFCPFLTIVCVSSYWIQLFEWSLCWVGRRSEV